MLADVQARNARGDGPKLAANLGGSVRLEIEHVQVARRPGEEDDEHGLRRPRVAALRALGEQLRQADAEQAGVADLQELATIDADGMAKRGHGETPGGNAERAGLTDRLPAANCQMR